jgi:hypothetical protein
MGSYTSIEAGFEVSIPDIDKALGQITVHPGRDAIVTLVDRYNPKTGVKTQKNSKVPAIKPFQRITIHYGGQLYIDKLVTDTWGKIPEKQLAEAWNLLGMGMAPRQQQSDNRYWELMERLTHDLKCELTCGTWGDFYVITDTGLQPPGRDAISLKYYDDPAVRAKISDLQARLEGVGFQGLNFEFIPVFHE